MATGLGGFALSFPVMIIGIQQAGILNKGPNPTLGVALLISGFALAIAGPIYAVAGSAYNATISDEEDRLVRTGNNGQTSRSAPGNTTADSSLSGFSSTPKEINPVPLHATPHKKRLWHPVLTGLGIALIGATTATNGGGLVQSILGFGGIGYAIWGGVYNANLPPEDTEKKAATERYGFTPVVSFSQSGKLQPGMMAWASF